MYIVCIIIICVVCISLLCVVCIVHVITLFEPYVSCVCVYCAYFCADILSLCALYTFGTLFTHHSSEFLLQIPVNSCFPRPHRSERPHLRSMDFLKDSPYVIQLNSLSPTCILNQVGKIISMMFGCVVCAVCIVWVIWLVWIVLCVVRFVCVICVICVIYVVYVV